MFYSAEEKKDILRYLGRFGNQKPSELGYLKSYRCPNCKGKGRLHQSTSDGRGEYDYDCKVCEGIGYTEEELKPKMVQIGWE